jgi:hypothetical protein
MHRPGRGTAHEIAVVASPVVANTDLWCWGQPLFEADAGSLPYPQKIPW